MKFKNGAKNVTLEDCTRLHETLEIDFVINDGKDVTFEIEK